jgi:hypothetical protein
MYKAFALLVLSMLLMSCASTPYVASPGAHQDGYAQFALNKDIYQVTFKANNSTSNDTVVKYLLRRSAEITVTNGYHYFEIIRVPEPRGLCPPIAPNTSPTNASGNNQKIKTYLKVFGLEFYELNDHTDFVVIKLLKKHKTGALEAQIILKNFTS